MRNLPFPGEEDPIFQASPAARFNIMDVTALKNLPKKLEEIQKTPGPKGAKGDTSAVLVSFKPESIVINGVRGLDGKDGEDGYTPVKGKDYFTKQEIVAFIKATTPKKDTHYRDGKDGAKGDKGDSIKGEGGDKGERGEAGEDGRDGVDGKDADIQEIRMMVRKSMEKHEKKYDHDLLHDPFTLGTKTVDEETIGDNKFLRYNGKEGKLVYESLPDMQRKDGSYISRGGASLPPQSGNSGKFLTTNGTKVSWGTPTVTETVTTITGTTTAGTDTYYLCDASLGAFTVNLPAAASSANVKYHFKKIDTTDNYITINGNLAETIENELTYTLAVPYSVVSIVCSGTAWFVF